MKPTQEKKPSELLAEVLNHECPEEEIGRVLKQCLTATTINRAGVVEPDYKTRLSAAVFVTTQRHGLPVRREEVLTCNVDADSAIGMEERLRHSPALRAMFRKMLDEVEDGKPAIKV
jgi:hypothetical protein